MHADPFIVWAVPLNHNMFAGWLSGLPIRKAFVIPMLTSGNNTDPDH